MGGPGLSLEPGYYRYQDLPLLRNRVPDAGPRYDVPGMPEEWTYKIKPGLPGRDYDHVPERAGDSEKHEQAAAVALGCVRGLMKAVGADGQAPAAARCWRRRLIRLLPIRARVGGAGVRALGVVNTLFEALELVLCSADFSQ